MPGCRYQLITAFDQPILGAAYKLCAIEDENGDMATMKFRHLQKNYYTSETIWRITRKKDEGLYYNHE